MASTYLILGHITVDHSPGLETRTGGAVYYGAAAAAALGWNVHCVTSAAEGGPEMPEWLAQRVTWCVRPAAATTAFENSYDTVQRRTQRLLALAGSLGAADVPASWRSADVVHLAPVAGELNEDVLDAVSSPFVGLAAQGWLRQLRVGGSVTAGEWRVPSALAARSSAIAVSEEDLAGVTASAPSLAALAHILAVTHGPAGASLYVDGRMQHVSPHAARVLDTTGAGDVFAATLFVRLAEGASPADAGRWASAQAAFAVESVGLQGLRNREVLAQRLASART